MCKGPLSLASHTFLRDKGPLACEIINSPPAPLSRPPGDLVCFDGSGGGEAVICRGRCPGAAGCSPEDGGGHRLQLLECGAKVQGDQDDSPWLPLCVLQVSQIVAFISRRIIAVCTHSCLTIAQRLCACT